MVCLLNSCLYVMFRSCFESLASVVPIKLVRAVHCGAPRIAAHRTYMGSCRKTIDSQFSNPRIDTASTPVLCNVSHLIFPWLKSPIIIQSPLFTSFIPL